MYSDKVLDHFHHSRNVGESEDATAVVEATNPVCGDFMKLWVTVHAGRIAEVRFKVAGCVPAIACGSWLTEWMRGKALTEMVGLTAEQIETALDGLPSTSHHAAVLAADALKQLLSRIG
jgi:nitrogen fixation NifU-like protein